MKKYFSRFFMLFFLTVFLAGSLVYADTDPAVTDCQNYLNQAPPSDLSNPSSKSAQCKSLIDLFAELAVQQKQLANQQGVTGNLNSDIKSLTNQINQKKTQIKTKIAHIAVLSNSISEKKAVIQVLSSKIQSQKDSIGQLLRKTNEIDNDNLTSLLFSASSLSELYSDISIFNSLESQIKVSVDGIKNDKSVNEQKKAELEKEQNKTIDEKQSLQQTQVSLSKQQSTQKTLLSISKDKESSYKVIIAQQQAKVAQIKARLFQLAGGAKSIRFDLALQYAQKAQASTGIDPAFLLAIATQESNLGANVGACLMTDLTTGDGKGKNTGTIFEKVMKVPRDTDPFLSIMSALGMDWANTPVSCPIGSAKYFFGRGYGGAMGPSQFIPSTWVLFQDRLKTALGTSTPNPWNAQDAFMASSLYLTDLGAVGNSYSAQIRAACKYYGSGGSTCSYGRNVMSLAYGKGGSDLGIQGDIDYLKQYGVSRR